MSFTAQSNGGMARMANRIARMRSRLGSAISQELDDRSNQARLAFVAINPVKTGFMKAHWFVRHTNSTTRTLVNQASYSIYLFTGTYKMRPNAALLDVLHEQLANQHGSITVSMGGTFWTRMGRP